MGSEDSKLLAAIYSRSITEVSGFLFLCLLCVIGQSEVDKGFKSVLKLEDAAVVLKVGNTLVSHSAVFCILSNLSCPVRGVGQVQFHTRTYTHEKNVVS